MSYGCGSITDGFYKLTVHINNFTSYDDCDRDTYVTVVGEVNEKGKLIYIWLLLFIDTYKTLIFINK